MEEYQTLLCFNRGEKMQKNKMSIHLQLAAIFERFELGSWDWPHFLCLIKLFSDRTIFA
jgi:hypothetical protein